jgi:hypothetical protein
VHAVIGCRSNQLVLAAPARGFDRRPIFPAREAGGAESRTIRHSAESHARSAGRHDYMELKSALIVLLSLMTNVQGIGSKTVEIVGSAPAANLAAHVCHKIEITGTAVATKKAAKAEGDKNNMKEERSEHHMRVQSVKMLGTTCP